MKMKHLTATLLSIISSYAYADLQPIILPANPTPDQSLIVAQAEPAGLQPSQPMQPQQQGSNPPIQSNTAGGERQTTVIDQGGNLKVVQQPAQPMQPQQSMVPPPVPRALATPSTNSAPTANGAPQPSVPIATPGTAPMQVGGVPHPVTTMPTVQQMQGQAVQSAEDLAKQMGTPQNFKPSPVLRPGQTLPPAAPQPVQNGQ